ncbi:MAG: hypothetical protein V1760_01490 [Candidatus Peregrinibacteria bacterium]
MGKRILKITGVLLIGIVLFSPTAAIESAYSDEGVRSQTAGAKTAADLATTPSECETQFIEPTSVGEPAQYLAPANCLFLEEPIGGRRGYDLYYVHCEEMPDTGSRCLYVLWDGGSISPPDYGPLQAILTFNPADPGQRVLFNDYIALIYKYLSGVIVGVVVLFVIVGGIQMTVSAGDTTKFDAGKSRIIRAITGLIFWFLASLILYTINPTFFAF